MNITKIIRVYFIFVMTLVCIGAITFNKEVKYYLASTFNISDVSKAQDYSTELYSAKLIQNDGGKVFIANNENPNYLNFKIINNPEKSFAKPGDEGIEVMQFLFKTGEKSMVLKSLKLKIVGVESENILKAVMVNDEVIKNIGKISDGYIEFENLNYNLGPESDGLLSLYLSLSPNLHTGQRIRMDIENPDDIDIEVGGEQYTLNKYYPIEGKYLSIAKPRPTSKK